MDIENKYGTLERQIELLPMLKDFHEFCTKNNIKYTVAYGTLLGAIRHNGFIPWDDDVDVMVDRKNYELLMEKLKEFNGYIAKKILWIDRIQKENETADNLLVPTIDIFIWDNVPNNNIKRKVKIFLLKTLQGMLKKDFDIKKYSFFYKVCTIFTKGLGKLFPNKLKLKWYNKVSKIGNKEKKELVFCTNGGFGCFNRFFKASIIDNYNTHPFENIEVNIMKEYDYFLNKTYGDYMKEPPEEERRGIHLDN